MRIALAQTDIVWQDRAANHAVMRRLAEQAGKERCDVIIFPEMAATGFSMDTPSVAESEEGPTASLLSALAAGEGINVVAGFCAADRDRKGENLAVAYDRSGRRVGRYSKMRPFSLVREQDFYTPGRSPAVFAVEAVPFSVFICYDLRFPELFRQVAREVRVIAVIANWPASRASHWEALLTARAIENLCWVVGVNRVGTDGNGVAYEGGSRVISPWGETVARSGSEQGLLVAPIDPSAVDDVRRRYPFLDDMT